jgi:PH and SEC7 domain-containing protein
VILVFPWPLFDIYPTSIDIVHAVSYSLLLLNTDLHVAELSTHMSRSQFVRNTMSTIQMQRQPMSAARLSSSDLTYDDCSSSVRGSGTDETEVMSRTRSKRSDSITSWNSFSREAVTSLPKSNQSSSLGANLPNGSSPSIHVSVEHAHGRAWENDMESLLKVDLLSSWSKERSLTCFDNRKSTMRSRISRFFNR